MRLYVVICLMILLEAGTLFKVLPKTPSPVEVEVEVKSYHIYSIVDTLCKNYHVNPAFVKSVGLNESGWLYANDSTYIRKCGIKGEGSLGDLQIWPPTRKYYFNKLGFDTITRHRLLEASICYMSELCERYDYDYTKVRYAYGRGHWKARSKWTSLEHHFMSKEDWSKF